MRLPPPTPEQLARRIRVARGQEPADLVLYGGNAVDVFTQSIWPANVAVVDGFIAGVGPFDWQGKERIDIGGHYLLPGLIDSHIHIESTLLLPAELARVMVPHGTSTLIADPHEVANVLGIPGIELMLAASEGLPLDCFYMASSCVPASRWEESGAALGPEEVGRLLDLPQVLGLAEMMDFPAILSGQAGALGKVAVAERRGRAVDGHAPLLSGQDLVAYAAAGIRSDHESTHQGEAKAKARLGMMVQVREGSAEHNLDELMPLLVADELGDWSLASDDVFPTDLRAHGHLDGLLRRLVAAGVPPARAVRHAALCPAVHYGLNDRGAVAPGFRADLVVVNDLAAFEVKRVYKDGRLAAENGRYVFAEPPPRAPYANSVKLPRLAPERFRLKLGGSRAPVVGLIPGQIVTKRLDREVPISQGEFAFEPSADVLIAANIERHGGSGRVGLGLVSGFGMRTRGALGSSVGHDAHNLIVAGTHPEELHAAALALADLGGGFVVIRDGQLIAALPLAIAGLLSAADLDAVCRQLDDVNAGAQALGCTMPAPFGILSFIALSVIPELRITTYGVLDVMKQEILRLP
jgi:adenine deaminase